MEAEQLWAEIWLIFRDRLDEDVGIRLQDFNAEGDYVVREDLPAAHVIYSFYDHSRLVAQVELDDDFEQDELDAVLSLFEEIVLEEIQSLCQFSRTNAYHVMEMSVKIHSDSPAGDTGDEHRHLH
ncbi:MAG TPA: hypothetical protein VGF27_01435 [Pseudoduganella sp.]